MAPAFFYAVAQRRTVSTLTPNRAATPRNPTPPALWASQRYRDEAGAPAGALGSAIDPRGGGDGGTASGRPATIDGGSGLSQQEQPGGRLR